MTYTASQPFETRSIERRNCTEYWINAVSNNGDVSEALGTVLEFMRSRRAEALSIRLFGTREDLGAGRAFLNGSAGMPPCEPVCLVQNAAQGFTIQVHAIAGAGVKSLYFENSLVGRGFEDAGARYYLLTISPDDPGASDYAQAKNIFDKAHLILESLGAGFTSTIRTWLFARDILAWYGELNRARDEFFKIHNIFNQLVPASTGVGIANARGAAMAVQVLAVIPRQRQVTAEKVRSPLQCPALDYKSSFSRAVMLSGRDHKRLYVSGTASIDDTGKTVFLGDTPAQIHKTMQVIDAILAEVGMTWEHTASAIAYFKYAGEFALFDDYCSQYGLRVPHVKVHADVCRDDLLFELELDAVQGMGIPGR